MPIRYQCDVCGSTLNIKDELAGSAGKCPKCKTAFVVPEPATAGSEENGASETLPAAAATDATMSNPSAGGSRSKKATIGKTKAKAKRAADDDFDPMAVLMGDGPSSPTERGGRPSSSPPLSDDEIPSDLALDLELGDDDEPDKPIARKAKKRKRVQFDSDDDFDAHSSHSASVTATAMLSGGASAGAKDLLTRTMEESRARASRIEAEKPRNTGPGLRDYLNEFGPKAGAYAAGFFVLIFGLYYIMDKMTGGGMPLPDLASVYGTVTLDGQPLEGATIYFTPVQKDEAIDKQGRHRFRASTAFTDAEGYYELMYTEDIEGAAVTEHRVVITKLDDHGRLVTPADYAEFSQHKKTVEPGSDQFDFALQSDPVPEPAKGKR